MKQCMFFCICCISFFSARLQAQQNHFIYLQTENKQPFYVKLDNNILSSSVSGYLLIPKLKEGSYNFTLGFPKKEWSEQKFSCTVANADAGYLVKNFGDRGWGLFNLQTLDISMAGAGTQRPASTQGDKTDEFSTLLSSAVNDPSILKKDVVEPPPVIKDTVKTVAAEKKNKPLPAPEVEDKVKETVSTKPAVITKEEIKKIEESGDGEAFTRKYVIQSNGVADTVNISIPAQADTKPAIIDSPSVSEKVTAPPIAEKIVEAEKTGAKTDSLVVEKQAITEPLKTDSIQDKQTTATDTTPVKEKFLPIDMVPAAVKIDSAVTVNTKSEIKDMPVKDPIAAIEKPAVMLTNSDCISNASDEDFLKLRKKMASASSDDDMIGLAKKAFKQKCFSTDQVKNLAVLFLKDEGRYNFFDQAYPHVWDSSNYKLLEGQLTDPYFVNRFKAMIRH